MAKKKTTLTCLAGHTFKIPPVIYGYPMPETFEAAERGEVTIGGCLPDLPVEHPCPICGLPAASSPRVAIPVAVRDETSDPA